MSSSTWAYCPTSGYCQAMVWQKSHYQSIQNFWSHPHVGQSKSKTRQSHQVLMPVDWNLSNCKNFGRKHFQAHYLKQRLPPITSEWAVSQTLLWSLKKTFVLCVYLVSEFVCSHSLGKSEISSNYTQNWRRHFIVKMVEGFSCWVQAHC